MLAIKSTCVWLVLLLSGSGDSGHVKTTAAGLWDSRELESVKSIAGFVSSFLSEADKFELAQVWRSDEDAAELAGKSWSGVAIEGPNEKSLNRFGA